MIKNDQQLTFIQSYIEVPGENKSPLLNISPDQNISDIITYKTPHKQKSKPHMNDLIVLITAVIALILLMQPEKTTESNVSEGHCSDKKQCYRATVRPTNSKKYALVSF